MENSENKFDFKLVEKLFLDSSVEISLASFVTSLIAAAILSYLIKRSYVAYSQSLSNRDYFSDVFIPLSVITCLVISVVKFSLALSLGLVGALSIVRFRAAIKEPEELAYLFICIAAGLGYGANQTIPTTVAVILILLLVYLLKIKKVRTTNKNIFLNLEIETNDKNTSEISKNINQILKSENDNFNLIKLDISNDIFQATYVINIKDIDNLELINKSIQSKYPEVKINFVDQNQVPNI